MFIINSGNDGNGEAGFVSTQLGAAAEHGVFFVKHLAYFGVLHGMYQVAEKWLNSVSLE